MDKPLAVGGRASPAVLCVIVSVGAALASQQVPQLLRSDAEGYFSEQSVTQCHKLLIKGNIGTGKMGMVEQFV